ncbi:MAG: hypothetical protein M9910_08720 [Kiritimatiellae bacterium]|nr:hypothetical protein [Kiritimatiellia bacterium]
MRLIFGMFVLALGLVASSSAWAQLTIAHDPVPFAVRSAADAQGQGEACRAAECDASIMLFRDVAPLFAWR